MALVKAPRPVLAGRPGGSRRTAEERAFVADAPDAVKPRYQRGAKAQVTLSISPKLLAKVDRIAEARGLSRSALLTVWLGQAVKREEMAGDGGLATG